VKVVGRKVRGVRTGISRKRRWVGYGRTADGTVGTTYGTVRTAETVVYTMRSANVCGAKLAVLC
jgi:hypothetical protein